MGPIGFGMVGENDIEKVVRGFEPTLFFPYLVYSLVPACRLASGASLSWEGYARLMLFVRSCSCIILSASLPWDSCPGGLLFLIPSSFGESCSSSGILMNPLVPHCPLGRAPLVPRCLVLSCPLADPRAVLPVLVSLLVPVYG